MSLQGEVLQLAYFCIHHMNHSLISHMKTLDSGQRNVNGSGVCNFWEVPLRKRHDLFLYLFQWPRMKP